MAEKVVLSNDERRFCYYMARLQNPEEAAARAGFGARDVPELMEKAAVRRYIGVWHRRLTGMGLESQALAGLMRIAFGSVDGAAELAFTGDRECDAAPKVTEDLYCISEIKCQKGGVEFKFSDRFKALELLLRWGREREAVGDNGKSLLTVLERSVSALEGTAESQGQVSNAD